MCSRGRVQTPGTPGGTKGGGHSLHLEQGESQSQFGIEPQDQSGVHLDVPQEQGKPLGAAPTPARCAPGCATGTRENHSVQPQLLSGTARGKDGGICKAPEHPPGPPMFF